MSAQDILDACAQGRMPLSIALMRLIGAAESEAELGAFLELARANPAPPLQDLCALAARHPDGWRLAHDMLATVRHDGAQSIERLAAMFDAAVALSPAASVALYSLGDESALDIATQEIVELMRRAGLMGKGRDMLDLGCGIGRFARALAPELRHVTGLDISSRMIAQARARCAALPNVRLEVSSGRDLAQIRTASVDFILAADVFPYLVQVDLALAATHVREAARVLRPGGAMLILNFSYRGESARDASDLRAMLAETGLYEAEVTAPPLAHWDAQPFLLRKLRATSS